MTNYEKSVSLVAIEEMTVYREQDRRASSETPRGRGHGYERALGT
jgi:hypothetical protein